MNNQSDKRSQASIDLTINKRPSEELYDLRKDPEQMNNIASDPAQAKLRKQFEKQIMSVMTDTNDPRLTDAFDLLPWVSEPKVLPPPR